MRVEFRRRQQVRLLLLFVTGVISTLAVSAPALAAPTGPPRARAAACTQHVAFGLIDATTNGCLNETSPDTWQSSDTVRVNGVPLSPASGTQLVLTGPSAASPGGRLSVNASITIAGVTFEKQGLLNWNLPAGNKGDEKNVVSTPTVNGEKLFGFAISGSAEIKIGWDARNDLRYFKFIGNLALPSVFKNGPEQGAGGLTATVGLRVDSAGVHADAVKAQVSNAYIGTLQVKNLCLSYVSAGSATSPCSPPLHGEHPFLQCQNPGDVSRWDGSAEVVIPTVARPTVGVWAGVQNGMFSYAGGQVTGLGNSVPIASGVYLENVALAVCVTPPPFAFKGEAGINVGPTTNGIAPVTITGSLQYTDSRPWVLEARGNVKVFGRPVADAFLRYQSDNTIDFGFHVNLDFEIASIEGSVVGWIEARNPVRFNVDGSGRVCVAKVACLGGEVTASSAGLAGCFTILEGDVWEAVKNSDWQWYAPWRVHWVQRHWRVRGGAGIRWAGGGVNLMGDSCDVGPYRAARSARAAAGGATTLHVAAGAPALMLQVQGKSAPPSAELIAPNGTRYASPKAAAKIVPNHELFVKDRLNNTTEVMIAHPAGGTWKIRPLRGSSITAVREASIDDPPIVEAGVGGRGEKRILAYSYQRQPLHTTRFVEEGAKYEQELGVARGRPCRGVTAIHPRRPTCGQIHFTPAAGPRGVRHIYALTTMGGEITRKQLVATYHAPPEPEPSEVPRLTVRRVSNGIKISWGRSKAKIRAAMPVDYNVDVNLSDGRRVLRVVRSTRQQITLPNVGSTVGGRVMLAAMRNDDTQGKTRTVKFAPHRGASSG
jgi:hypothetical protein